MVTGPPRVWRKMVSDGIGTGRGLARTRGESGLPVLTPRTSSR